MSSSSQTLTVITLQGDAKVLLAFNLPENKTSNLAGFTILCSPEGIQPYYLFNKLQFEEITGDAQVATEPAYSSINAPIQKFRWLHVPGNYHQKDKVVYGDYTYCVTPRYFNADGNLEPIDKALGVIIKTKVAPFTKATIELGFTRGFVQSQAFASHFSPKAIFKPQKKELLFDTSAQSGVNSKGEAYTFLDEYIWSGFTAREKIFGILEEVLNDDTLFLDVFAYDLNEPDILKIFLTLAKQHRIRIILDNATLHHSSTGTIPEDEFEKAFIEASKDSKSIIRGKFGRFQHNKILIVTKGKKRVPIKVLTGSTNLSVTGMYVNSNHIIVFNNQKLATTYAGLFTQVWEDRVNAKSFIASNFSDHAFSFKESGVPETHITFAPHKEEDALSNLNKICDRIKVEKSSVLFAVMGSDPKVTGPVAPALIELHKRTDLFSCGITDSTNDITYYKPSSATGIRVTGKPGQTLLPEPFTKEATVGIGHQIHHKFIVCGFNTADAVVWLGSSNLALGGEESNGDNLIEIHDKDIATVFAIEALALVDHFQFRDAHAVTKPGENAGTPKIVAPATNKNKLFLQPTDKWSASYYAKGDLHYNDRILFSQKK